MKVKVTAIIGYDDGQICLIPHTEGAADELFHLEHQDGVNYTRDCVLLEEIEDGKTVEETLQWVLGVCDVEIAKEVRTGCVTVDAYNAIKKGHNTTDNTAIEAITESAQWNRIVFIPYDEGSNTLYLLKFHADDYVDVSDEVGTYTIEVWGTHGGDEWRVHVTGVPL